MYHTRCQESLFTSQECESMADLLWTALESSLAAPRPQGLNISIRRTCKYSRSVHVDRKHLYAHLSSGTEERMSKVGALVMRKRTSSQGSSRPVRPRGTGASGLLLVLSESEPVRTRAHHTRSCCTVSRHTDMFSSRSPTCLKTQTSD